MVLFEDCGSAVARESSSCTLRLPFDERERDELVQFLQRALGATFTDGRSVRLERIDRNDTGSTGTTLLCSKVGFFDFVASNLVLLNRERLLAEASSRVRDLVLRMVDEHAQYGPPVSVGDILGRPYLSNIVAISCLISDTSGRTLLVKRRRDIGVGGDFLSVSVTGSMDWDDLASDDPIKACCARECGEELGVFLNGATLGTRAIVCGLEKLQPIALIDAIVGDIGEVVASLPSSSDFHRENSGYLVVDDADLRQMLDDTKHSMTEAGRFHLESHLRG